MPTDARAPETAPSFGLRLRRGEAVSHEEYWADETWPVRFAVDRDPTPEAVAAVACMTELLAELEAPPLRVRLHAQRLTGTGLAATYTTTGVTRVLLLCEAWESLPLQVQAGTLVHEALHAVHADYGTAVVRALEDAALPRSRRHALQRLVLMEEERLAYRLEPHLTRALAAEVRWLRCLLDAGAEVEA